MSMLLYFIDESNVRRYFYLMINVGALVGQIGMVFAENYVGFYTAFLLSTTMFIIAPGVLLAFGKKYHKRPPTGSVLGKAVKLISLGIKEARRAKKEKDVSANVGFFNESSRANFRVGPRR